MTGFIVTYYRNRNIWINYTLIKMSLTKENKQWSRLNAVIAKLWTCIRAKYLSPVFSLGFMENLRGRNFLGNRKKWRGGLEKKKKGRTRIFNFLHMVQILRTRQTAHQHAKRLRFGNPLSVYWHRIPLFWSCDPLRGDLVYKLKRGSAHAHQSSFIHNCVAKV